MCRHGDTWKAFNYLVPQGWFLCLWQLVASHVGCMDGGAVALTAMAAVAARRAAWLLRVMTRRLCLRFAQGLRLHDNPALLDACAGAEHMYPIFVLDPHFMQQTSYK